MKYLIIFFVFTFTVNAQLLTILNETATPNPYGEELVTNGDMELDSEWNNSGTPTLNERSSVQAHGGTYSRHVTTDGANEGTVNSATGVTVEVGKTYLVSAWVYNASGRCYMHRNVARLNFPVQLPTTETGVWQYLSVEIEASSSGVEAIKFLSVASGAEFYVDDVSVKEIL